MLRQNESKAEVMGDSVMNSHSAAQKRKAGPGGVAGMPAAKRNVGSMVGLSGGQNMSYVERNKSVNKAISKDATRSKLFRKRAQADKAFKKDREAGLE